jgi:hypothetical protein
MGAEDYSSTEHWKPSRVDTVASTFVEKTKVMHYTPRQHHCLVRRHIFSPVSECLTRPLVKPICLPIYSQVIEKVCLYRQKM